VTNYEGENIEIPESIPMLPIRDIVVFPYMILPLFVGRDASIRAVEESLSRTNRLIFLSSQKDLAEETPDPEQIYEVGTVALIMRMRKLTDGRVKILIQGLSKARIKNFIHDNPYYNVAVEKLEEKEDADTSLSDALIRTVKEQIEKVISLGKVLSPDILMVLEDIQEAGRVADLVASNLNLKVSEAQSLLEIQSPEQRLQKVSDFLTRELEVLDMQAKIRSQARDEMSRSQKEYFLREQIRQIKSELGDQDGKEEMDDVREKVLSANMPEEVEKEALKQLGRLERMHPDASEASIIRNYLDWMVDLPWNKKTEDNLDIIHAKKVLDEDHFELNKVKDRILEFLAVRSMKSGAMKGPILCLSGPPGVGKTSLGKSIARSLGRTFHRISLGGVRDEAEIRGHRRTYVGSLPGRIIQGLKQVGTNNPVFLLDEVDKLGSDFRGDPASALLEVLDPEQNGTFRDHYLNVPFDLSKVMFIATANDISQIPPALKDRMEILELPGYTAEDKIEISKRFLTSKQMEENGITTDHIEWTDEGLKKVILYYTREAGLRNLERLIGNICRKTVRKLAESKDEFKKLKITEDRATELLGPPKFLPEDELEDNEIGVVTGLAWTQFGGEILYVEATWMQGDGKVHTTGSLGDVMKESAQASLGYIRSNTDKLKIDEKIFKEKDFHIHFPAGAVPKDGPSAGVTVTTALVSLITQTPVRKDVAMTGEVTLTGKVLPIGGLKEKALAALRLGIKKIVIPFKNKKDLEDIPDRYRKMITFFPVKTMNEVLDLALLDEKKSVTKKSGGRSKKGSKNGGHYPDDNKQIAVEKAS
jgi:ATP-dependent Lon protease